MAVKTKAQILAEIASLLADNTTGDISASDIRTCLNDITDSYGEITEVSGTLTAAQVNALDATPIEVIPAQGANKAIIVDRFTTYAKTGTAFTTAANLRIGYNNVATIIDSTFVPNWILIAGTPCIYSESVEEVALETTYVSNLNVAIDCGGAISAGTQDIDYIIRYKVISL